MEQTNPNELISKIDELKNSLIRIKESAEIKNESSIDIEKLDNVITDLDNIMTENTDFQNIELKDSLLNIFDSINDILSF